MGISATFIDEISHDIPHQNWGEKEWAKDFQLMKAIGINTVVLIRCGYKKWLTYPSTYLIKNRSCFRPSMDLVQLFLDLAGANEMRLFFGLYDSGAHWLEGGDTDEEITINKHVIDEVWQMYGGHPAFAGWYLPQEVSRGSKRAILQYNELGSYCKKVSNGLPTLISPYIDGSKAVLASESALQKSDSITLEAHELEWDQIFNEIYENVDIVAFQDGHVNYEDLKDFLIVNKKLADHYGMETWTNVESFDRDMPIKFLPIKWDKMKYKLEVAREVGIETAITFEFSHFMSPQSAYMQAGHLYNRYKEWLG